MIRYNQVLLHCISEIAKTDKRISEKEIKANEKLVLQNEEVNHVYIIKEGIAKCFITENNGKDYILEFFGIGEIIGELEILNSSKSLSNVEAISSLSLYKISKQTFLEILKSNWNFNQLILQTLATRLAQTASRASYQQNYPLEYSILKLIYLFSNQPFKLNKKDLSDYLGITTRSLNRTLLALQQKGILEGDSLNLVIDQSEIAKILNSFEK